MPFQIIKGNILDLACDAIVNPTDEFFSGSGGLDAQIHEAAGDEFTRVCCAIGRTEIGKAVVTVSPELRSLYVIHTVAPWWSGRQVEIDQLRECYRSVLKAATAYRMQSIAFPLIGSGTRGFPKELVLRVASEELRAFLSEGADMDITLVVFDRNAFQPSFALLEGLEEYRRYIERRERERRREESILADASTAAFPAITDKDIEDAWRRESRENWEPLESRRPSFYRRAVSPRESAGQTEATAKPGLILPHGAFQPGRETVLDESFSQMVLRKIDERGFKKDSECYTRANIDKRLFSKIRSDNGYHPKKTTAVALAIALELSLEETQELLMKAGYSLSHSILFDLIVEYCIMQKDYNIFEVNELLFQYDQPLLGG